DSSRSSATPSTKWSVSTTSRRRLPTGAASRSRAGRRAGRRSGYPRRVMAETRSERRPRRDADGRLVTIGDLLGVALAGLVCGVVVLLLFEGVRSFPRLSEFAATNAGSG